MLERTSDQEQDRAYSWDDLLAMPEDNRHREIIGGVLEVTPSPGFAHWKLATRILRILEDAAGSTGETIIAPSDVVQPDVLFIRGAMDDIVVDDRITRVPDLVVEIISPSSASTDRIRKFALYATHGVAEYWLIDPRTRAISLQVLENGTYLAAPAGDDGTFASRVVTGFILDPQALFAGLPAAT
jgi:Uma2 family endonuclease